MSNRSPNSRRSRRSPSARGAVAPIAIRVNPDVDARTHAKISTGKSENKFGVPISRAREVFARARALPGLVGPRRRHAYRFADHRPRAVRQRLRPARRLRAAPCAPTAIRSTMSMSAAGLGIPYRVDNDPPPFPDAYAEIVARHTCALGCQVILEPGRLIVGNAGVLVASVIFVKTRRAQDLRHRRCGDERPDPADPLRRLSRHPAGRRRRRRAPPA